MRNARVLTLAMFAACVAATATAGPIISGNGESWTSSMTAVCAQVGAPGPCGGVTVAVTPHPSWQDQNLTSPLATWVSYADTGYQGAVLAPRAGSPANPTGQNPIMNIVESFTGTAGGALTVRFWADDTLNVYYNNVLVKAAVFTQGICADRPIGCETNEFWDLNATLTGGLDVLRLEAFQVGAEADTTSNPFGVLYAGSFADPITTTVPEPITMSLLGLGLAGACVRRSRRG